MRVRTASSWPYCASVIARMLPVSFYILTTASTALLLFGCGTSSQRQVTIPAINHAAAKQQWDAARTAWLLDDVATAQAAFSRFAESNPEDPRSGEALLTAGICAQRRGRAAEADGLFREAQTRGGAVAARAFLQRGYLLLLDHPDRAVHCFGEAARLALDGETRAEGWLQHGLSLQRSGQFSGAVVPLQKCANQQDAPGLAARARLLLQYDPWFTVQVGAFLEKSNAQRQLRRLESAGLAAEHRIPGRSGSPLHRVLSGRFENREDAIRHSLRVKTVLGTDDVKVIP